MPNQIVRSIQEHRPLLVILTIAGLFAILLGCGGGGGGGGGSTNVTTNVTTDGTTDGTVGGSTTSETTGSTGSTLPSNRVFFGDSAGNIQHMTPDGSDNQNYVTFTSNYKGFAQSPVNANKVVFGYTATPGSNADYALYTNTSVNISGAVRLTNTTFKNYGSIQFTPDGSKLVFTGAKENPNPEIPGNPEYIYRLFVISSSTPGQNVLDTGALDFADDSFVAPTGTRIVYTFYPLNSSNSKIKSINLDGTNPTVLAETGNNFFPQYNKTGTKISFCSDSGGSFEIWTMNSNGTGKVKVTADNATLTTRNYGSTWSPDGTQIVYTRTTLSSTTSGVFKVAATGGAPTQLIQESVQPFVYWSPTAGPIGRSVAGAGSISFGTSERVRRELGLP